VCLSGLRRTASDVSARPHAFRAEAQPSARSSSSSALRIARVGPSSPSPVRASRHKRGELAARVMMSAGADAAFVSEAVYACLSGLRSRSQGHDAASCSHAYIVAGVPTSPPRSTRLNSTRLDRLDDPTKALSLRLVYTALLRQNNLPEAACACLSGPHRSVREVVCSHIQRRRSCHWALDAFLGPTRRSSSHLESTSLDDSNLEDGHLASASDTSQCRNR
jgi:hypothetical protein